MRLVIWRLPLVVTMLWATIGSGHGADYHMVKEIPVGGAGGYDYLTVDPASRRLYVSHGTKAIVIDIEKNSIVGEITDTPGIHGIVVAPELKRGFTSNGRHNKLMEMIDSTNGKIVGSVPIGSEVDGNAFDSATQLAFSSNGDGTVTIAHEDSPDKLTVVQNLKTQKGARTIALDPKSHNIYLATGSGESFKVLVYGK